MIQSHCVLSFFLEFFVWKRCTSSKFKQNKLEIQSCFVPIISNVDDRTYNGPAKRIRLRGVMSHDKRMQFRWVSVLATVTTTLPATAPTATEQEPTAATSAAPNLLNDLFTGKVWFQVSRITLICIFSNKAKSSVLNKLCFVCSILPQKVESSLQSSFNNFLQSSVSAFVVWLFISIWKRHRP